MKKRGLLIVGVILAVLLAGGIFTLVSQPEPVAAVRVKREDVVATLTVTGEVHADRSVAFSPTVSELIAAITVDEGDVIHPGQLLVQLDAGTALDDIREATERAAQAQAALANVRQGTRPEKIAAAEARYGETAERIRQAQAAVASQQARALDAEHNAERLYNLYKGGMASEQEYENVKTQAEAARQEVQRLQADLAAARTQRAQAAAQLQEARRGPTRPELQESAAAARAAQAAVDQTKSRLSDYRLVSDMRGLVIQRLQDPGDLAQPGQPVLRAVNPDTLEVLALVEENDLAKVQAGDEAYILLDAQPNQPLAGRVRRVGSRVNPENGTVEVRVALLPTAFEHLKRVHLLPGMTADVNVVTEHLKNAMVLPATAVRTEGAQQVAYVFKGDRLVRQPVRAERISVENVKILSGLQPGDWVALTAAQDLLKKRRVKPVSPELLPQPSKPPGGMAAP